MAHRNDSLEVILKVIKSIEEEMKTDTTNLNLSFLMIQWVDCLRKVSRDLETRPKILSHSRSGE